MHPWLKTKQIFVINHTFTCIVYGHPQGRSNAGRFQEKKGNFLYRDEGDQQKLSKRSINLSGQGQYSVSNILEFLEEGQPVQE